MTTRATQRLDFATLGLLAGTAALTASVYGRLPARLPTHFDVHGVVNGTMERSIAAWLLPAIAAAIWALLRFGARLLPAPWRARLEASPTAASALLVAALLCGLHAIVLHAALAAPASVGVPLAVLLGVFWVALGLLLPRVRRNPWLGVRTPWTLSSDENWARTHRFAGIAFCVGGVLAIVAGLGGLVPVGIVCIVVSALVPAIYSFVLARKLPRS